MLFSVSLHNLGFGVVVEAYCLNRGKICQNFNKKS